MPRNAAGVYSLPNPPVVPDTTIEAADENTTRDDIAEELTNSLDRNGRGGMLAPFRISDGTLALPGLAFSDDPDNGIYRSGANTWSLVVAAAVAVTLTPAGVSFAKPITVAAGTITASAPSLNVTQTWNAGGVTFVAKDTNITDTASAALSIVERWRVGGTPVATIFKNGNFTATGVVTAASATFSNLASGSLVYASTAGAVITSPGLTFVGQATNIELTLSGSGSAQNGIIINNTHASGLAYLAISANGTGDAFTQYTAGASWYSGVDNSASDIYTIGTGLTPGSSDWLRITTAGAITALGALTVQGAFTSIGIDDNATSEALGINDTSLVVGTTNNDIVIRQLNTAQTMFITGSTAFNTGANIVLRGSTHATLANDFSIRTAGTNVIAWDDSANTLVLTASSGVSTSADLSVGDDLFVVGHGTTASAANAFLNSGTGELLRSTSAEKFKRDLATLGVDHALNIVRNSRALSYRSNLELCEKDNPNQVWYGFGANQIYGVDPILVDLDNEGQPERVQYERYVVPHNVVLQDLLSWRDKVEDALAKHDITI